MFSGRREIETRRKVRRALAAKVQISSLAVTLAVIRDAACLGDLCKFVAGSAGGGKARVGKRRIFSTSERWRNVGGVSGASPWCGDTLCWGWRTGRQIGRLGITIGRCSFFRPACVRCHDWCDFRRRFVRSIASTF